jgi:glycosyltransferase involved in cell wall biosynthesis
VCFTHGADCTRCHGRNTWPGVRLGCRGTGVEAVVYGAGLALWQRRLAAQVDAFVVPSQAAHARLRQLGAPVQTAPVLVLPHVIRSFAPTPSVRTDGPAVLATRLAPEKGVDVAIDACRSAGVPLVIAGDGPERAELEERARGAEVSFVGRLDDDQLARLRAGAGVAVLPSRAHETFGLAAAEAMAAGLPVAATAVGAVPELVPREWLAPSGDAGALAEIIVRLRGDAAAGRQAIDRVRAVAAPEIVAPALARVYDGP